MVRQTHNAGPPNKPGVLGLLGKEVSWLLSVES